MAQKLGHPNRVAAPVLAHENDTTRRFIRCERDGRKGRDAFGSIRQVNRAGKAAQGLCRDAKAIKRLGGGMLVAPDGAANPAVAEAVQIPVIASGGVTTLDDIRTLQKIAAEVPTLIGAIVGRAIYEGTIDVAEACAALRR